jgi:hypothetical protein
MSVRVTDPVSLPPPLETTVGVGVAGKIIPSPLKGRAIIAQRRQDMRNIP